jgi:hypothetical protein
LFTPNLVAVTVAQIWRNAALVTHSRGEEAPIIIDESKINKHCVERGERRNGLQKAQTSMVIFKEADRQ